MCILGNTIRADVNEYVEARGQPHVIFQELSILFVWFSFIFILCLWVFCLYTRCIWSSWWSDEGRRSPGIRITESCEPPYWCWELNQDLLEEGQCYYLLSHLPSLALWRNNFSLGPGAHPVARMAGQWGPGIYLHLPPQLRDFKRVLWCPAFSWTLNSGPHACTASTLSTELSHQPLLCTETNNRFIKSAVKSDHRLPNPKPHFLLNTFTFNFLSIDPKTKRALGNEWIFFTKHTKRCAPFLFFLCIFMTIFIYSFSYSTNRPFITHYSQGIVPDT